MLLVHPFCWYLLRSRKAHRNETGLQDYVLHRDNPAPHLNGQRFDFKFPFTLHSQHQIFWILESMVRRRRPLTSPSGRRQLKNQHWQSQSLASLNAQAELLFFNKKQPAASSNRVHANFCSTQNRASQSLLLDASTVISGEPWSLLRPRRRNKMAQQPDLTQILAALGRKVYIICSLRRLFPATNSITATLTIFH